MSIPRLMITIFPALLLCACGGGEDVTTSAADSIQIGQTASSGTGATSASGTTDCGLSHLRSDLLQRINALRAQGASCGSAGTFAATTAVQWHATLASVAAAHSTDMAGNGYFSHTGLDGSNVGDRVSAAGYNWSYVAENIAAGQGSVAAVMNSWSASAGHCANMMNSRAVHIGVACVRDASGTPTWTMVLARPMN